MISDEDKCTLQKLVRNENYLPLIINTDEKSIKIKKLKFIVLKTAQLSNIVAVVRQKINLSQESALFLFTDNVLAPLNRSIGELYESHGDKENKVLLFTLKLENTFGF